MAGKIGRGKFFSAENLCDISCKRGIRIFLCRTRNEQEGTGYAKAFRIGAECFPQQPFDPVADDAFAVFFSHAHREPRLFGRHPDNRQACRVRTPAHPQDLCKILSSLDPQVLHGALRGDVLSSLVSSSLERLSSALRLHAGAEPVYLASLPLLGLICSLHLELLDCFRWSLSTKLYRLRLIIGDFRPPVKRLCHVSDG